MNQETVMGMVLFATPIGEYDKRLVLLTKERGRISAFAKGARKPNSALLACSQPFVFGKFTLYRGRTYYSIVSVEVQNYFEEVKEDLESIYYGVYFCEFASYFTFENIEAFDILKLLYQSLRALSKKSIPNKLIRYIFELKVFCFHGQAPQVFECVKCKKGSLEKQEETKNKVELIGFSSKQGGLLCSTCKELDQDLIFVDGSTIYTLQYIESCSVEKLYTFVVTEEVLKTLEKIMKQYIKTYANTTFRSLEMLEII